jgi:hypothetical protein
MIILLNIIIGKAFINRAIRKFVIAKLESKGLSYLKYKWTGLFSYGDFKNEKITFRPSFGGGSPWLSIYVFIFYLEHRVEKRMTIKIDTFMFFIRTVVFSDDLFNN